MWYQFSKNSSELTPEQPYVTILKIVGDRVLYFLKFCIVTFVMIGTRIHKACFHIVFGCIAKPSYDNLSYCMQWRAEGLLSGWGGGM